MSASSILVSAHNLQNTDPGKPNHVYELNPKASDYWFGHSNKNEIRLARCGVHGDGSCAYHSVCYALNINDYVHQSDDEQKQIAYKFRCNFSKKLTQDALRSIIKKSRSKSPVRLNEVQDALCDPKIWADETTIRFMAETLDLNLLFLDMTKNKVYCGVHHDEAIDNPKIMPKTMIICWVNHTHFEPLGQIIKSGPRISEIRVLFEPSKNEDDERLVRHLMKRYKTQCKL